MWIDTERGTSQAMPVDKDEREKYREVIQGPRVVVQG